MKFNLLTIKLQTNPTYDDAILKQKNWYDKYELKMPDNYKKYNVDLCEPDFCLPCPPSEKADCWPHL